jgi:hypothetical protein
MKIGILPLFTKGFIDNGAWCKAFLRKIDTIGVESVWTVEHPIVAEDYEQLYSYSDDGKAPFTRDTVMPDPAGGFCLVSASAGRKRNSPLPMCPITSAVDALTKASTLAARYGATAPRPLTASIISSTGSIPTRNPPIPIWYR